MPIVVVAKTEADYQKWVVDMKSAQAAAVVSADREWSKAELIAKGEEVYKTTCTACHQANGKGVPGAFPALAGSAIATGPADGHVNLIMHGKQGTAMQGFANQLSDTDIAAVVTYERNSWGNNKGDLVQPMAIKALRQVTAEKK